MIAQSFGKLSTTSYFQHILIPKRLNRLTANDPQTYTCHCWDRQILVAAHLHRHMVVAVTVPVWLSLGNATTWLGLRKDDELE